MKRIAFLLLASSAFAVPAFAADIIVDEAPAPPVEIVEAAPTTWTGFYAGVQGGYAFGGDEDRLGIDSTFGYGTPIGIAAGGNPNGSLADAFAGGFSSDTDDGFLGGVHVGYDQQFGDFVVGGIVDVNAIDISETQTALSNTPAFYQAERSLDYLATARVRAGYLATPSILAYATGGLAYGEVDYSFSTDSPAVSGNPRSNAAARPAQVNEDEDDFGYTVGGGVEFKLTENASFGTEYLYTNLGGGSSTTLNGGPFDGAAVGTAAGSTTFSSGGDFDFHTVTAKLSYRFN